jgi:hypothetical protein
MKKKHYILIYGISLTFFLVVGLLQKTAGYMDASYYYATGRQLALGKGAVEPFLWNYLNDPQVLPSPAFTYWMPLSALLAALGMWVGNTDSFLAARFPFIALSALIPCLSVFFVSRITNRRIYAALATTFGLLCGSYLPYLTITDSFTPVFILGAIYLLIANRVFNTEEPIKHKKLSYLLLGIIAGLLHLTRADGILWLGAGFLVLVFVSTKSGVKNNYAKGYLIEILLLMVGYLCVMSGWFIRNLTLFGSIFPVGSNLAMLFTRYDDLFMYPASSLTFDRMLETGLSEMIRVRGRAFLTNLETLVGVAGNVVLLPFMVIGGWKERKNKLTQFVLIMLALLFVLMALVFPFAGYRGGFFHSISAFQIYLWVLAIIGIEATVHWSVRNLKWVEAKARTLFFVVLVLGIAAMTGIFYINKVQPFSGGWDQSYSNYHQLDTELQEIAGNDNFRVMINDSPGYYSATNREAMQLSSGTIQDVSGLLDRFDIDFLIIDKDVPDNLRSLYETPGNQYGFRLVEKFGNYLIYIQQ